MKYFLDTEFVEGPQDKRFLGIKYGQTKPTIDLISIGIVSEENREYYAVCSDFNIREAWNRFQIKNKGVANNGDVFEEKEYWLRDNVLKPIFDELLKKASDDKDFWENHLYSVSTREFTFYLFKELVQYYGKSRETIANEIKNHIEHWEYNALYTIYPETYHKKPIEFYAYYCSYDWVVFCWIFGTMMKLPEGFPKYCNDIKQLFDQFVKNINNNRLNKNSPLVTIQSVKENNPNYPINNNEHHALSDARFDKDLYYFLNSFKNHSIEKHTDHDKLVKEISNNLKKSRERNTIMSDFQSRLKNEFNDLAERSEKLFKYLGSDHYKTQITPFQQEQLEKQYHAMNAYLEILKVRIEDLGIDMSPDYVEAKETVGTGEKTRNSVLEAVNRRLTCGAATDALKRGLRVSRSGWNGKGMYLFMQVPSKVPADIIPKMTSLPDIVKKDLISRTKGEQGEGPSPTHITYQNQIALVKSDCSIHGWNPSTEDLLAEDWIILD